MSGNTRRRILRLYWGSMATGALLPLAVDLVVATTRRAQTPAQYLEGFYLRLFAPQESVLMLALLGGAPFLLFGVFALIHLGTADRRGEALAVRRQFALQLAFATMVGLSAWGHYSIMTARGSTAALGFLFLPFYVLATGLVAYAAGRWFKRFRHGPAG